MDEERDIETGPGEEGRMPLIEHLKELRVRLIRAVIALAVGFAIAYWLRRPDFPLLTVPLRAASNGKVVLIGTGVGEAFFTKIKVAMVAALFIASPAVLYELWSFIAPGLYQTERRMARAVRDFRRRSSSSWADISAGRWC